MKDQLSPRNAIGQPAKDTVLPTHSDDGVDLTLIRWMLSLTPAERLQVLQDHVNCILSIQQANEPH
jgi:hypothetical protein